MARIFGTQIFNLCGQRSFTPVNSKQRTWMSAGRTGNMPVFRWVASHQQNGRLKKSLQPAMNLHDSIAEITNVQIAVAASLCRGEYNACTGDKAP